MLQAPTSCLSFSPLKHRPCRPSVGINANKSSSAVRRTTDLGLVRKTKTIRMISPCMRQRFLFFPEHRGQGYLRAMMLYTQRETSTDIVSVSRVRMFSIAHLHPSKGVQPNFPVPLRRGIDRDQAGTVKQHGRSPL